MKDVPGAAGKTGHPLLGKKSRFSPNLIGQVKARLGISRDMKNAMCYCRKQTGSVRMQAVRSEKTRKHIDILRFIAYTIDVSKFLNVR